MGCTPKKAYKQISRFDKTFCKVKLRLARTLRNRP